MSRAGNDIPQECVVTDVSADDFPHPPEINRLSLLGER